MIQKGAGGGTKSRKLSFEELKTFKGFLIVSECKRGKREGQGGCWRVKEAGT